MLAKRFGVAGRAGARAEPSDARRRRLAAGARRLPGREARAQGRVAGVEVRTLTDGGQPAEETAHALADVRRRRAADARDRDLRPPPAADARRRSSCGALARRARSAASPSGSPTTSTTRKTIPVPPPPQHGSGRSSSRCPFPTAAIPGVPDLMHHKYVVRDARRGLDRLDELDGRLVDARGERHRHRRLARARGALPRRLRAALDDARRRAQRQGRHLAASADGIASPWFCPGRGEKLAHRIAKAIGTAQRRVRIASPVHHARRRSSARSRRSRPTERSTSPASSTATQVLEVLQPVARERERRRGRSRCCGRRSRARRSRASSRRRTRPARCTTTCTRR